ncbi:hypothetical protein GIB67_006004, partial [Kingdonia uniflora]
VLCFTILIKLDFYLFSIKIKTREDKATGGISLPLTAQTKPQAGDVVHIGEGTILVKKKLTSVKRYLKYAGTEFDFNESKHHILKEDDIVVIIEAEDVKDLKLLNKRVLIKVTEAESETAGGLLQTEATKENLVEAYCGPCDALDYRQGCIALSMSYL